MKKQRIEYDIVDDFDKKSPAEPFTFTHHGSRYEIDLSEARRRELGVALDKLTVANDQVAQAEAALMPYLKVARRLSIPNKKRATRATKSAAKSATKRSNGSAKKARTTSNGHNGHNGHSGAEIRAWAKEKGLDVGDRGAIPKNVIDEFMLAKDANK